MKAIPTMYQGRQYRSRLEARWAAFFDLLKWQHEYEPFDLDGWIPDFQLGTTGRVLVEVRPQALRTGLRGKIERACPRNMFVLLLSEQPFRDALDEQLVIGELLFAGVDGWCSRAAAIGNAAPFRSVDISPIFFEAGFYGIVHGQRGPGRARTDPDQVRRIWAHAGNQVQWKAPA